jgi:tRNA(Ile)-lysidine synthase
MEERIHAYVRQACRIRRGEHVLAAVSGGADSMALMHLLCRWRVADGFRLSVAHLDHGLRRESAEDARFVCAQARALGLDCIQRRADVAAAAAGGADSLEMAARRARYRFLDEAAASVGAGVIATGHTRDDQAETVLLRLARGAGCRGLAAMRPRVRRGGRLLVRPLLDCRREALVCWLREQGIPWREDASNAEEDFLRNRVRRRVLPVMAAQLNPSVQDALARSARILAEEDRWLDAQARRRLAGCRGEGGAVLRVEALRRQPPALRRRIVARWLCDQGVDPARLDFALMERIESVLAAGHPPVSVSLPGGMRVEAAYGRMAVCGPSPAGDPGIWALAAPGVTDLAAFGVRVVVEEARGYRPATGAGIGQVPAACWVDRGAVPGPLSVRGWRDGDRMAPGGMPGTVKLQDVWVDRKVPRRLRRRIPLLVCADQVVWVPGYRVAAACQVPDAHAASWHVRFEPLAADPDPPAASRIASGTRCA